MRIGQATLQCTLVTVFLRTGCGGAHSRQATVLIGSLLPQDQGWSVSKNAVTPLDVVWSYPALVDGLIKRGYED